MEKAKVIELKETILEDNNADAQVLRQELKAQKTLSDEFDVQSGKWKDKHASGIETVF